MARRHAPGACPKEGIETPAMGGDDCNMELPPLWESNKETEQHLAAEPVRSTW